MSKLDQLKHKLPQEPGILDKETKYFNSAVLVPILEMSDGYHLLFQKRQELIKPIQDQIYQAVEEIATTGNYAIIFDKTESGNMIFTDVRYDLSDEVLRSMGYRQ